MSGSEFLFRFRNRDARGHAIGAQATKTDLVDIARALGLSVTDRYTVPEVRACIRARLDVLHGTKVICPAEGLPHGRGVKGDEAR